MHDFVGWKKKKKRFAKFIDRSRFTLNHCQLKNSGLWDNLFVTQFVTGGLHTSRRAFTLRSIFPSSVSMVADLSNDCSHLCSKLEHREARHVGEWSSSSRKREQIALKFTGLDFYGREERESRGTVERKRWVMEGRDFKTLLRVVTGQRSDFLAFHIFALER